MTSQQHWQLVISSSSAWPPHHHTSCLSSLPGPSFQATFSGSSCSVPCKQLTLMEQSSSSSFALPIPTPQYLIQVQSFKCISMLVTHPLWTRGCYTHCLLTLSALVSSAHIKLTKSQSETLVLYANPASSSELEWRLSFIPIFPLHSNSLATSVGSNVEVYLESDHFSPPHRITFLPFSSFYSQISTQELDKL